MSAGLPQSRSSSAPASRSATACASVASSVDLAVLVEADVAVRVDEAGDDPAAGHGLGAGLRLVGDPAVDDVEVAGLAVGQDRSGDAQCSHASGPYPRVSDCVRCASPNPNR